MYSPMSIARPPVLLPIPATQVPRTARAAWETSYGEAVADDLVGLNSNSTVQSPSTVIQSDDKEGSLEGVFSGILTAYCSIGEANVPCRFGSSAFAKSHFLPGALDRRNGISAVCED